MRIVRNNPVMYEDPSEYAKCPEPNGQEENTRKKSPLDNEQQHIYDDARANGMTAAEAYQMATGNIGVKPQYMTNKQMQMANDDIYRNQFPDAYNSRVVMGLTVTEDGRVILSANSQVLGSDAIAKAQQIIRGFLMRHMRRQELPIIY